jgi:drug/metabolite transporter (DMT)-like permease
VVKHKLGYDDSLDVFGIHGVAGIVGAVLTGVFSAAAFGGVKGDDYAMVMLAAGTVLKEQVGLLGWISAALGFAGVLLIARPGSGLDPWGVALCLINACLATGYHLLTRILARTETTMALMVPHRAGGDGDLHLPDSGSWLGSASLGG